MPYHCEYLTILDNPCIVSETDSVQLSADATPMGGRYATAWRWVRDGKLPGRRRGPHTLRIPAGPAVPAGAVALPPRAALAARGSSAENQGTLACPAERLVASCTARGYQVATVVK